MNKFIPPLRNINDVSCFLSLKVLFITLFISLSGNTQSIYNPQNLYEAQGGLFDKDSIRDLYINFYEANYHDTLVESFFNNPSYRIPATVNLSGILHDFVGVRYKGNSTFCLPNDVQNPKVPYNIDMNYWLSGQTLMGKKKIKLANAWLDPTFSKEFIASKIYRKYLPTPEANLLKLHVQDDYLGLYVNTESINKQFCEKHFGEKEGVLFKCDPIDMFCDPSPTPASGPPPSLRWLGADSTLYYNSYNLKSEHGWEQLMRLVYTLKFNTTELDSILNIDRALWAFAVNTATLNLDTYNGYYIHNYYLYQTEDGLFQMIPWDLSESFTGAILGFDFWNPDPVYNYDPYGTQFSIGERPLLDYLLNHPLYRKIYTAHLRTVLNETMSNTSAINNEIDQLQSIAEQSVIADPYKLFNINQFYENVDNAIWSNWGFGGIISSINARNSYLSNLSEIAQTNPVISQVSMNGYFVEAMVSNPTQVELMATISPHNSKFNSFPMHDDGSFGDALANDGIYTAELPYLVSGEEIKFYVRSHNSNSVFLSPERAEYEFYTFQPNAQLIEVEELKSVKVYPNPSSSQFYLVSKNASEINCEVLNLYGQIVLRKTTLSNKTSIDLSNQPDGMYILKANGENLKIIKKQ
ncbi:MAG: CotH kinase family protein [Crocinitomicaceae bacterium]